MFIQKCHERSNKTKMKESFFARPKGVFSVFFNDAHSEKY